MAGIYCADVGDRGETEAMFDAVERDLGPVDLLVTNAGIARSADALAMSAETWHEIMRVNLDGTFHAVWRAKEGMVARGFGRIVCISSVLGLVPNPISVERLTAAAALKRFGRSEEIAELVHFLLSERSSFTTGQTHVADGGTKFVP